MSQQSGHIVIVTDYPDPRGSEWLIFVSYLLILAAKILQNIRLNEDLTNKSALLCLISVICLGEKDISPKVLKIIPKVLMITFGVIGSEINLVYD